MVKVYETKEDLEKHELSEQANSLRQQSLIEAAGNFALIGGSCVVQGHHDKNPRAHGWLTYLRTGMMLSGLGLLVKSLLTAIEARKLDLQREQMGPENVALLTDTPKFDCPMVEEKLYSQSFQSKTPLQHAARSQLADRRKV
jgi:hypothetical protein